MFNKNNVVIMFLLIMLSFAIISEVSAASDAEIEGTGLHDPLDSVKIDNHDIAGESDDAKYLQNHDDFKSHNGQNSFNQTPDDLGDKNNGKENSYEREDVTSNHDNQKEFDFDDRTGENHTPEFNHENEFDNFNRSYDAISPVEKPADNFTGNMDLIKPREMPVNNFTGDKNMFDGNAPNDLRDNQSFNVPQGELMDDVISNLMGMNNISPNFKNDDKLPKDSKNANESAPQAPGAEKAPGMWKDDINKKSKAVKKTGKNLKKQKMAKKSKKPAKKLSKRFNKERAKL